MARLSDLPPAPPAVVVDKDMLMQGLLSSRSLLCFEVGLWGLESDSATDWQILRGV